MPGKIRPQAPRGKGFSEVVEADEERRRRVTELMRESAAYVLAHDDEFYTRREVWEARRFLAATEPPPEGWAGRLPGLAEPKTF